MKTSFLLSPVFGGEGTFNSRESGLTALDLVQNGIDAFSDQDTLSQVESEDEDPSKPTGSVIDFPQFEPLEYKPTEFFAAVQEWEGTITAVFEDHFQADLYDLAESRGQVTEVAEISFEDIDPEDRFKVREGAIFRWLIGHSRTRSGRSSRKWVIYFRRAPKKPLRRSPYETLQVPEHLKYMPIHDDLGETPDAGVPKG